MRPDEHKKKKNEQYKKKHGIKSTKGKAVGNQSTDKQGRASQISGHVISQKTENLRVSEEEDIQRHFSKRKVESNWHRYEAEEEIAAKGESQEPSGADFQQLLSQKVSSLSQFRFKEEQVWEPIELKSPHQLSVNCNDLLSAVVCVPLHERLDIDEQHFEKSHLEKFEETAGQCRQLYMEKLAENKEEQKLQHHQRKEELHLQTKECLTRGDSDEEVEPAVPETTVAISSVNSSDEKAVSAKTLHVVLNNNADRLLTATTLDLKDIDSDKIKTDNIADDLDELLGICDNAENTELHLDSDVPLNPDRHVVQENAQSSVVQAKEVIENLEDQLDKLLHLDEGDKALSKESSTYNTKKQDVNSTESTVGEKKDVASSLEDWLDDLLDE